MKYSFILVILFCSFTNIYGMNDIGSIIKIIGDVKIERYGERGWHEIKEDEDIYKGDRLRTMEGFAIVLLKNSTKVRMNEYSLIEFSNVSYDYDTKNYFFLFKLFTGEIYVNTIKPHNQIKFISPDFIIEGTNGEFDVKTRLNKNTVFKSLVGTWTLRNIFGNVKVDELFYIIGKGDKPLSAPKKITEDFIPIWQLSKFATNYITMQFDKVDTNIVKCKLKVFSNKTNKLNKKYKGTLKIISYSKDLLFSDDKKMWEHELEPFCMKGKVSFFIKGDPLLEKSTFFISGYEIKPYMPTIHFRKVLDRDNYTIKVKTLVKEQIKIFFIKFKKKEGF